MTPDSAQVDLTPHHKRTAYHECGHAMLCLKRTRSFEFDEVVVYASLQFDEGCIRFGRCYFDDDPRFCRATREEWLLDHILETLTGPEAERLLDPTLTADVAGWDGDYIRARGFIKQLFPNDEDISNHLEAYRQEAAEFVTDHWAEISKMAERLLRVTNTAGDYCLDSCDVGEFEDPNQENEF